MPAADELQPLLIYNPLWAWLGTAILVSVVSWLVYVFVSTRRKKQRTLATLKPKPYTPPDISAIKIKYLDLIAQVQRDYSAGKLTKRVAHQSLGKLIRLFVYEINGSRVDTFTLAELKRSRYPGIAKAVEAYYPPAFKRIESGDVDSAIALAREAVESWD